MTYPRILAQIITKDIPIKIPDEIIHFYNNDYIHFPLKNYWEIEDVKNEFSDFETIDNLVQNRSSLSSMTCEIIALVDILKINNLMIEYTEDPGDSYPLSEIIILVIKDNKIVPESISKNIDEDGEFLADVYLGYDCLVWDYHPFRSYDDAVKKYKKE
jgi:hypothetical protein